MGLGTAIGLGLGVAVGLFLSRLPQTLLTFHRTLARLWWRWRSRHRGGRPRIDAALIALIHRMSIENPLWGAPRIHGELLKLGLQVAQSTVSRYMVPRHRRPSQDWRAFMRDNADAIASIDMLTVPTAPLGRLYAVAVLGHARRRILHVEATDQPTAEWLARAITEAFPWDEAPVWTPGLGRHR